MLTNPKLSGLWTALVTPFDGNWNVDLSCFRDLLQAQKDAGVTGVVPCGTTGESPTLSEEEKKSLIQTSIAELKGSGVRVMAGTGSNNTNATIEFSKWASDEGADAILVVCPYYNKPTQAGLIAHFTAVADAVDCDVVLYNIPGRTGISLTPESIVTLADHPKINAVKDATGSLTFTSELIHQLGTKTTEFAMLSGDDITYVPFMGLGGNGVISVASNLMPRQMRELHEACVGGHADKAAQLHQRYYPAFRDFFIEANPAPIKEAMARAEMCEPHVRLPLVGMQENNRQKLMNTLKSCELIS